MAVAAAPLACAHPPASSRIEDNARRDVPIAICRRLLSADDLSDAGTLRPDVYVGALVPNGATISAAGMALRDCTGEIVAPPAAGVRASIAAGWAAQVTMGDGRDGVGIVWLRAFAPSDGRASGPLALVRPWPAELDVYATGSYSGSARHSRFELARLGSTWILLAYDLACADVPIRTECESTITFYIAGGGQLLAAAQTPAERFQYATMKDVGRVHARLTTDPPRFDASSVRIRERLSVRDSNEDEVRKSEDERVFTLRDGSLVADERKAIAPLAGQ